MISESKLSILQCPVCKGDLSEDGTYLVCNKCNAKFPVIGDIIVFLTKADLADFLNETWGNELQKEHSDVFPDFFFASNEDKLEDLQKMYDEATREGKASHWNMTGTFAKDPGHTEEQSQAIEDSKDEVVKLSRATSSKRILDWPTGYGACIKNLIKKVDPETLIVALDVNFRTMAKIKPYFDENGFSDNMLFIIADARKMPLKDNVFQSVTVWGAGEIARPNVGFKESFRVLEEGGWVGTFADQYKESSPSMKIAENLDLGSVATRTRLESMMKLAGFKNLEYKMLYDGYDIDLDVPDEDRCPLPARGDWFQLIVASGQK